ncbi:MAG: hypothetical protein AAF544_05755 [Bacteroidota bacterium]
MDTSNENDIILIRIIRSQIGRPWTEAKDNILNRLPEHIDPGIIDKFIDQRDNPGIYINAYGVEPRFYLHRISKRLLEFYPSK